jgi:GT2 family glycosyltransferase
MLQVRWREPAHGAQFALTDPLVTVLIPIHRGAELLKTSLATVLAQTFTSFEVIVAGDGCIDDSEGMVWDCRDPRVRWMGFPKAPGFGYANRARALAASRGALIAYLAPDDLWLPDHLDSLVTELETGDLDFVFCRPVMLDPGGAMHRHAFAFDVLADGPRPAVGPRLYFLSGSQLVHSRNIYERAGGWDSGLTRFGDVDLWLRMRRAGARMGYVPHPSVIRLPALDFREVATLRRDELHARAGGAILDGSLRLPVGSWPLRRRVRRWLADVARVGMAKGAAFVHSRWISLRQPRGAFLCPGRE